MATEFMMMFGEFPDGWDTTWELQVCMPDGRARGGGGEGSEREQEGGREGGREGRKEWMNERASEGV